MKRYLTSRLPLGSPPSLVLLSLCSIATVKRQGDLWWFEPFVKAHSFFLASVLFFICFAGCGHTIGQTSIDESFNVQVSTTTFSPKEVGQLIQLPDGKVLAAGHFSEYNGESVGGFIRLNSDYSLDHTFNNSLFPRRSRITRIMIANSGRQYVKVFPTSYIRLEASGTVDPSFTYGVADPDIYGETLDMEDRLILVGFISVVRNGETIVENVVRLNQDGSVDLSFDAPPITTVNGRIAVIGEKIFVAGEGGAQNTLYRLDSSGTAELSAVPIGPFELKEILAQPDGKLLVKTANELRRVDGNGLPDPSFSVFGFGPANSPRQMLLGPDGRITVGYTINSPYGVRYVRLSSNGTMDPSFEPYHYPNSIPASAMLALDNSVVLGDSSSGTNSNRFMRLLLNGSVDIGFNPGGSGFLSFVEGRIRAILPLPNNQVLIGGDFQRVNGVAVNRIARLNADGTLDSSFGLTVGTSGNVFSKVDDIYGFTRQPDGKILISGSIWYWLNSVQKLHIVRVDSNGNIDTSFNLGVPIIDYFGPSGMGKDKMLMDQSNRIFVGTSAGNTSEVSRVPLRLNPDGSRDMSYLSSVFSAYSVASVYDMHRFNDGKLLISGRKDNAINSYGFLMRLNADATADPSFQPFEIAARRVVAFRMLQNGKVLAVTQSSSNSQITLFGPDGTPDNSFVSGVGANGNINAIEVLDDGTILAGGLFTSYNGQARQNLVSLDLSGAVKADQLSTNGEVLCFSADENGRIFVGGAFTSLTRSTQSYGRTYIARLVSNDAETGTVHFDYDGDGRADLSVRRPSTNVWYFQRSSAGYTAMQWGVEGDRMAPADFDGDGKTDVAIFRPSNGRWYVVMSATQTFRTFNWGADGDLPVPSDRDGDGSADLVLFRPSNNTWYASSVTAGPISTTVFGVAGDKPVVGDFDGDGRGDVAVFRPSNSTWYIRKSTAGFFVQTWGQAGDIPVPADYDGDGSTDLAIFRPSLGRWYRARSTAGFDTVNWGQAGDIPVAADYDGDGTADAAVFRPANGTWYLNRSASGFLVLAFGQNGDVPTQSAFIY